jgi:signal transduction histidine kinase
MEEQLRILLVDDDAVDRMAVRRALRAVDRTLVLVEAEDSATALDLLASERFDCVLLDYRLPGVDGLAVLRQARERSIATPVVMLTGQGDELLAVELMKAGASDYITKGELSPDRLIQSVRSAVRVYRAEVQAAQAEHALRESAERLWFLAEASRTLAAQLDSDAILTSLLRLTVPYLADWCAVDVVEADGRLRRISTALREGASDDEGERLAQLFAADTAAAHGSAAVLKDGVPEAYPPLPETRLLGADAAKLADFAALDVGAVLCVPMAVRGRVLGAVTLVRLGQARVFVLPELYLALDLGQRAATALDNALLYRTAQDAIRLRDAFLATASHELKTPLTSLFGNAQLLVRRVARTNALDERDQRVARVIVEQAARLDKMIGALLDISRLQTGQLSIVRAPLELGRMVERLVEELRPTLEDHQMVLLGVPEPLPLLGDELRLHQVLHNLLNNAIKYSPNGGTVTLELGRQGDWAVVSISDQGIGIPEAALPHLFTQFYRATNVSESQISGIGLGLYVVKEIVELHGGTVAVQSVEGQGSTFVVRLPLMAASAHAADQQSCVAAPALV